MYWLTPTSLICYSVVTSCNGSASPSTAPISPSNSTDPQHGPTMPPIIPNRFLVRMCHPCPYVREVPNDSDDAEHLVDLPDSATLQNFADLDELTNFADVRLGWNEFGLAVQLQVKGKAQPPVGDADRPKTS